MDIRIEELNDKELQYLVSKEIDFFLEPIKQNPKSYMQFNSALGQKNKKSILVQKNLPRIATKLYCRHDRNYVKAMEIAAEKYANILIDFINKEKEISPNGSTEIAKYNNYEIANIIQQ